jgi:NAD-dependent deacetylase
VHELHGSIHRNHCTACGTFYDLAYLLNPKHCVDETGHAGHVPRCEQCGGVVKPDVVLYEEPLDYGVMHAAERAVCAADTLIVGGTSLVVYPAAGYVDHFTGKNLIFINKGETGYDAHASLIIRDSIGEVLGAAARSVAEQTI